MFTQRHIFQANKSQNIINFFRVISHGCFDTPAGVYNIKTDWEL